MTNAELAQLAADLTAAQAAAGEITGAVPIGVRAVAAAPARRDYLCAYPDAAFLCLDDALRPARSAGDVQEVAACVLLVEHGEGWVDATELSMFATLVARVARLTDDPNLVATLGDLQHAAADLHDWREADERAVASLAGLEDGVVRHDRLRVSYERFIADSEPLVAVQDTLPGELLEALRELELAAGRAGALRPLSGLLAEAIGAIDAGAREIVAGHLTPLDGEPD